MLPDDPQQPAGPPPQPEPDPAWRLNPTTGEIREVPTEANPYGIKVDSKGKGHDDMGRRGKG